jgi:hypothetical protein
MAAQWRKLAVSDAKAVEFVQARLMCLRGKFDNALSFLKLYEAEILAAREGSPQDLELYASALAGAGQVDKAAQVVGDRFSADREWSIRYLRIGEVDDDYHPDQARIWLSKLDLSGDVSSGLVLVAARTWCKLGDVCTQQGKGGTRHRSLPRCPEGLAEDPDVANNLAYLLTTRRPVARKRPS